jgi:hypothetical protein
MSIQRAHVVAKPPSKSARLAKNWQPLMGFKWYLLHSPSRETINNGRRSAAPVTANVAKL